MKQIFIFTLSLFTIVCFGQTTKGKAELEKALAGNIDCQKSLGVYYSFGWEGFPKNAEKSFYWYKKAALQNDSEAQLCIAEYYRYGGPIAVNTKEAIYWYKCAADNAKSKEAKEDAIKAIKELGGEYKETNNSIQFSTQFGPYQEYDICSNDLKKVEETISAKDDEHFNADFDISNNDITIRLMCIRKNSKELIKSIHFTKTDTNISYGKAEDGTINTFKIYSSDKQFLISRKDYTILLLFNNGKAYYLSNNGNLDIFLLEQIGAEIPAPDNFEEDFEKTLKIVQQLYSK